MLEGSFLKRKLGPMPMYGWMGILLAGALAVASWRKSKTDAPAKVGDAVAQNYGPVPAGVQPTYTFIDADQTYVTVPTRPPTGGRGPRPPGPPVPPAPGPVTPTPTLPTTPIPPQPAPAPAPAGQWVTVVKYAKNQPKGTPSTLWGIAEMIYKNGQAYGRIWNAPQNADLRARRGAPEKIQPGDRFFVPA